MLLPTAATEMPKKSLVAGVGLGMGDEALLGGAGLGLGMRRCWVAGLGWLAVGDGYAGGGLRGWVVGA